MARKQALQTQQTSQQPNLSLVNNKLKIRIDDLKTIEPLTENQTKFFNLYKNAKILLLHGVAGTGKTYIALYKALEEVLDRGNAFKRVIIVRSAVPSREIGHLPGDEKEKTEVYQQPYIEICEDLFSRRILQNPDGRNCKAA